MNASQILKKAAGHMEDRASTYDKPDGERSMAQTVAIFNLFHGTSLTEAQGWHLLQILKDVRLFSRPGYHADSAEDCTAYSALKAEAKSAEAYAHMAQIASQAADLIVDCRVAAEDFLSLPEESGKLPVGLSWTQAPEWATVLLDGLPDIEYDPSKYSWAEKNEVGARRRYCHGGQILVNVEDCRSYIVVATRPTKKAPCPHCAACLGSPHTYGKPGYHGAESPAESEWTEADERRMDVVGQNGNDGAAYNSKGPCLSCGGPHNLVRCGRNREEGKA